jgi:hypothetical protein
MSLYNELTKNVYCFNKEILAKDYRQQPYMVEVYRNIVDNMETIIEDIIAASKDGLSLYPIAEWTRPLDTCSNIDSLSDAVRDLFEENIKVAYTMELLGTHPHGAACKIYVSWY